MGKHQNLLQRLKDKYDRARNDRLAREEMERPYKERLETIFTSHKVIVTDFWCDICKRDCSGPGYREVCTIRSYAPTAWYVGYCPLGHKMIRRITDKNNDSYYDLSEMVQRHRAEMKDDFLSPDDPRFKLLYPEKYAELMKKQDGG